ncbi:hypothetical protein GWI33_015688 [Rhynchophorus ferrugineus]|uniref:Uncharacterized protein n=1 Tax=Rhynchophorus ferrugineus TaxID=354439 RepID=A0A834I2X8_RHYFE|nr:hypothetical protein GWI33_015688 [Rhynchophorus ferrugineus]
MHQIKYINLNANNIHYLKKEYPEWNGSDAPYYCGSYGTHTAGRGRTNDKVWTNVGGKGALITRSGMPDACSQSDETG